MSTSVSAPVNDRALQEEARMLAVSLAKALAASSLSEREKAAWARVLPEMRLDQLSRFAVVLDASVAQSARAQLSATISQVNAAEEKHAAIAAQTDHDFMQSIAGMVDHLRTAERGAR